MKTIFITVFEGVEAKNILRTPILTTLLKDSDLRIVLFTKNPERMKYYKKEFQNPQISYEVVPYGKSKGIDKIFARLKFHLLKSETTDLRRKMQREEKRNYVLYAVGHLINWCIARPIIRRMVRVLDFALVRDNTYKTYFDRYKPELVFMAHLFNEPEIHFLREAKKRNIRTIGFINSWDKVTARCTMRLLPDKVVVFNNIVKKEMMVHNEMNEHDIFVGGIPQYDQFVEPTISQRETFFKRIGIDSRKKLVVYAPIGKTFSRTDWEIIDALYRKQQERDAGFEVLVRFQPNDFVEKEELEKRPHLKYDHPGLRFSATRGVDWDMNVKDLQHLTDTLHYMSLIICYASSISVDAAFVDKPIINIDFELTKNTLLSKSPMQFYRMAHYKNAINTGGIKLVHSFAEMVEWIEKYLDDPSHDQEGRKKLVKEQCQFADGKSGERIGKFILETLQ